MYMFLVGLFLICASVASSMELSTQKADFVYKSEYDSTPPTKVIVKDFSGKDVSKVVLNKFQKMTTIYFKTDGKKEPKDTGEYSQPELFICERHLK